ncbi:Haloacid dehalogenase-like hydrolase domain-containing protein 2 [Willisornis vidua]|uniref:Haloacid dehalogenase-like hydrolase domain-containing protein 2 n=1 Tax=Willisornis vidua TaxID=1566151 RepID=A0ABQ9DUH9_9PASS|nr:Haloacid dehalogenase-like hydrolase domain-containing protein 2 [Willisornis vidua]
MAFTLYSLLQASLLIVNAVAVLHEERFLRHVGWGSDQGIGGFGEEPGIKAQLMNLIRSVRTVMRGIGTDDPNAVVVGLAPEHFHYEMMNRAFRLILNGAPLIAIHKARYFKKKDGLSLGPGPFVTGLEYATDTKAMVVGKPEKTFFLEALRGTGCVPEEAVMIGDDCRDDVGGAQEAGMRGILVRTGKYRPADEDKINPAPYLTCESFPEAVEHILQRML